MTTFTIQVDEATAKSFQAAAAEREMPVEELIIGMAEWTLAEQEFSTREPFTPEQVAELEQSLAEAARGEFRSHEDVMTDLRKRFPAETGRQIMERALQSYRDLLDYEADMPALHEYWDAQVQKGLAAMQRGDEAPQDEVFARWRARYG